MPTDFTTKTASIKSTHITARNINVKSDVFIDNVSVNDSLTNLGSEVSHIKDEFNRVTSNIVNSTYLEEYSFAVSTVHISSSETDAEVGIFLNILVDDPVVPRVLSIILGNDVVYVPITYFQNEDGTKGIKIVFSDIHITDLTEIFNGFFSNPDNEIKLILSKTITVNN